MVLLLPAQGMEDRLLRDWRANRLMRAPARAHEPPPWVRAGSRRNAQIMIFKGGGSGRACGRVWYSERKRSGGRAGDAAAGDAGPGSRGAVPRGLGRVGGAGVRGAGGGL